jgi:hypothetical protein
MVGDEGGLAVESADVGNVLTTLGEGNVIALVGIVVSLIGLAITVRLQHPLVVLCHAS